MPNRLLKESICTSDNLNRNPLEIIAAWVFLLTACDDFGRMYADPHILKGRLFPFRPEITIEDIDRYLAALQSTELLTLYEVEGRRYLQLAKWTKHNRLRAKHSKYPSPDAARQHMSTPAGTCKQMPVYTDSDTDSDTDAEKRGSKEPLRLLINPVFLGGVFFYERIYAFEGELLRIFEQFIESEESGSYRRIQSLKAPY